MALWMIRQRKGRAEAFGGRGMAIVKSELSSVGRGKRWKELKGR